MNVDTDPVRLRAVADHMFKKNDGVPDRRRGRQEGLRPARLGRSAEKMAPASSGCERLGSAVGSARRVSPSPYGGERRPSLRVAPAALVPGPCRRGGGVGGEAPTAN